MCSLLHTVRLLAHLIPRNKGSCNTAVEDGRDKFRTPAASKGSGQGLLGSRVEQIGLELAVSLGIFNSGMNTPKGVQYVMYEIHREHSSTKGE